MAALAEGYEIALEVVGGVVIAVSRSQYDPRRTDEAEILDGRKAAQRTALLIAPGADAGIPPAPITEMVYRLPMRPTAALAGATCSPKTDRGRELRLVDGVEEAVLRTDRHEGQPFPADTAAWLRARACGK